MKRFLSSIADVRKGEGWLTFLMALYYYLVLVTYYFLKPARDSLFLVRLGPAQLPIVFIATALAVAPITAFLASASRRQQLTRLIAGTSALMVACLAILRWLLSLDAGWVFYLFYVWVSIFGALTAAQFWLLANAVYTPAQAKRLFPLLSMGGILGAMTGGEITRLVIRAAGVATEDLLYFCMVLSSLIAGMAALAWRLRARSGMEPPPARRRGAAETSDGLGQLVRLVRRSPLLSYTVGIIAVTVATTTLVDFQFKTISAATFPEKEALTSFLAAFYGRVSLAALIVQAFLSYRLLRYVGVGGVVLALPLGLLAGSAYMLAAPGLLAAVLLRGADRTFSYSLDKTGRELLFLPIPLDVKKRVKVFIDVFVDRWARGLAGALLLLLVAVLGVSARGLSVVVMALLLGWIALAVLVRRQYVDSFRAALARREIDPAQLTVDLRNAQTVRALRESLRSRDEREIAYALDVLGETADASLAPELEPLLGHPSAEIRLGAVRLLGRLGTQELLDRLADFVRDVDPEVRLQAMHHVSERSAEGAQAVIARFLADADLRVRATAMRCAAEREEGALSAAVLQAAAAVLTSPQADEVRADVARALGALRGVDARAPLRSLMKDPSAEVALAATLAAGRSGDPDLVPDLLGGLADVRTRRASRAALAAQGEAVIEPIAALLADGAGDTGIHRHLPAVLAAIPTPRAVHVLAGHLVDPDPQQRHRVIKALNKLRRGYPELAVPKHRIDEAFVEETRAYYGILEVLSHDRPRREKPGEALMTRALEERLAMNLERAFRLLGLAYPADDIYNAYLGTVSRRADRRASALELLDNVLGRDRKRYLFPIIDPVSESETLAHGRALFGRPAYTREEALERLAQGGDSWLRACARYCLDAKERREGMALTIVEKVIFLRGVDVFTAVPTEQLSVVAAVTEELHCLAGEPVYREGEAPDALYLVVEGAVRLHRGDEEIATAGAKEAFGTWALLDDEPRVTSATAAEDARLLRVDREDFAELLADHTEITQGVIKTLAGRVRGLLSRVGGAR
jgi:ATP/ADP translocase